MSLRLGFMLAGRAPVVPACWTRHGSMLPIFSFVLGLCSYGCFRLAESMGELAGGLEKERERTGRLDDG